MRTPSIAWQYVCGRLGAAALCSVTPSASRSSTEHSSPLWRFSMAVHKTLRISGSRCCAITIVRIVSSRCERMSSEGYGSGAGYGAVEGCGSGGLAWPARADITASNGVGEKWRGPGSSDYGIVRLPIVPLPSLSMRDGPNQVTAVTRTPHLAGRSAQCAGRALLVKETVAAVAQSRGSRAGVPKSLRLKDLQAKA